VIFAASRSFLGSRRSAARSGGKTLVYLQPINAGAKAPLALLSVHFEQAVVNERLHAPIEGVDRAAQQRRPLFAERPFNDTVVVSVVGEQDERKPRLVRTRLLQPRPCCCAVAHGTLLADNVHTMLRRSAA